MQFREQAAAPAVETGQRQLYQGANDGLTRAMEIAIVPLVFGAAGYGLDRLLGIVPVLTIALVLLAAAGLGLRMWYAYARDMEAHEAASPWSGR